MTLNDILMFLIIVGVGYWMFRKSGGCCGSKETHRRHRRETMEKEDGKNE